MSDLDSRPLFYALRPSLVWQRLIEFATPEDRHDLVTDWLTLYYGRPSAENPLSHADIIAAFWIDEPEFQFVMQEARRLEAMAMMSLDSGLSMKDAERLLGPDA